MNRGVDFEVAVIGGGVVGGTLAALLGGRGLSVASVESGEAPLLKSDPEDARVLALTLASERVLRAIGAWQHLESEPIGCFREMRVWDEGGSGAIHFDSAEIGEPTLGHIVPARLVEAAVSAVHRHLPAITAFRPAELEAIAFGPERVELRLADGRTFRARLVVGADGAASRVRRLAGIEERTRDYHQSAVCCTALSERPHGEVARQRFLSTGPIASLPLADPRRSAIVWSTSTDLAGALMRESDPGFRRRLEAGLDSALGAIVALGPRSGFPLVRAHAERYTGERVVLIGDAAHRIHPLAGQGANLGIMDAAALAEVLEDARGGDPGERHVLRRYERWRKGENLAMMLVMDVFKEVFGTGLLPVRLLRNLGLSATDRLPPLKRLIMRRAVGLAGDLPRLAVAGAQDRRLEIGGW